MATPQAKITGLGSLKMFGETLPFQVQCFNHMEVFTKLVGVELNDYEAALAQLMQAVGITATKLTLAFAYAALYAGAKRTSGQEPDFSFNDLVYYVEDVANDLEDGYEERQRELEQELLKPFTLQGEMFVAKKKGAGSQAGSQVSTEPAPAHPTTWDDIIALGMGELGLGAEELFALSFVEWDYKIEHYRLTNARNHWEPLRELYALVATLGGEKKTARELIPLYTDAPAPTAQPVEKEETNQELWQRLIGSPHPLSPLTPTPSDEKIMTD